MFLGLVQEQANLEEIARYFAGFELMGNPVTMVKEVRASDHVNPMLCDARNANINACINHMTRPNDMTRPMKRPFAG